LIYYQQLIGVESNRRSRTPMIDPVEVPVTIAGRVLAVGATYIQAPPTWNVAGFLYQELDQIALNDSLVFPGIGGGGQTALDTGSRRVLLNNMQLYVFPRLASEHRYRFEAMRWIPRLTLAIWEYIGTESDSDTETLEAIRVDLARLEVKVDSL
jgi:hypothetical protein